ncbi:hypothetical protein FHX73_115104 [Kitasatospora viridis]|uniref:Uncharacterized protein n=1 Tax=Kitasatospora viridis TaxID=281105 RepID=A0A561UPC8_9ACTN|nr:hypothetical protein FHX73_115104 [Kitasatospora viridis]
MARQSARTTGWRYSQRMPSAVPANGPPRRAGAGPAAGRGPRGRASTSSAAAAKLSASTPNGTSTAMPKSTVPSGAPSRELLISAAACSRPFARGRCPGGTTLGTAPVQPAL